MPVAQIVQIVLNVYLDTLPALLDMQQMQIVHVVPLLGNKVLQMKEIGIQIFIAHVALVDHGAKKPPVAHLVHGGLWRI